MNSSLSRGNRIFVFAIATVLLAALLLHTGDETVLAQEGGIQVQSQVGYQGMIKQSKWHPVRLTLTNQTDADLKGELVLSVLNDGGSTTDYVVPAELPKQTAIEVTLSVSGETLNKDTNKLRFYQDSFSSGRSVPIIGSDYLDARVINSYAIGVVSSDPDTLNFMPSLNQKGYHITVIPISKKDLPQDAAMLGPLNTLVINDTATGSWETSQIKAITEWVVQGGTLVLSGGAGYSKTFEAFKDIAPVEANGTLELESADAIEAAGSTELQNNQPITISIGNVINGQIELSQGGIPIAVSRKVGFGTVVYAAFDPSLEPLASWSGSAMLWARLLQHNLSPLQAGMVPGSENLFWNLNQLIDEFPSIHPPNFLTLLIMFSIYMLIVAPLLYAVLAKADRREWAWWIIPSLSVVMGIVVFFIGAGDKRVMTSHTIEIVELAGDGHAVVSGATGLFIPAGGKVELQLEEKLPIKPYSNNNQSGILNYSGSNQIIETENGTKAVWRSVPYWSTRKLWMDRKVPKGEELKLTLALEQRDGGNTLKVTNNTTADLMNLSLLADGQVMSIGDLKRGESGEVTLSTTLGSNSGFYNYGYMMYNQSSSGVLISPSQGGPTYLSYERDNGEWSRQRQLVDLYFNRFNSGFNPLGPVLIGFSMDNEPSYDVNGNKVKTDNLKMWVQQVGSLEQDGDRVYVPAGNLQPVIISNSLQSFDQYGNGMIGVGTGELILEYFVPNSSGVTYDTLDVSFNKNSIRPGQSWSIWNEASGEWESIALKMHENPIQYLIEQHSLRFKLEVTQHTETSFPQITLEGEGLQL